MDPPPVTETGGNSSFPATRWSLVIHAQDGSRQQGRRALEELCRLYWFPLYAFVRRSGFSHQDSEDLVQEFLSHVIERWLLRDVSADKGKLRSWLLALLKPYLANHRRKTGAIKRGGRARIVSIDAAEAEARYSSQHDSVTPEAVFEKRWAVSVFGAALESLHSEYRQSGKGAVFDELSPHLQWQGDGETSYAESATRLGMSEGSIKVAVYRLRRRFRESLRNEVAHTLNIDEDVDSEMRHLLCVMSS